MHRLLAPLRRTVERKRSKSVRVLTLAYDQIVAGERIKADSVASTF